MREIDLRNAVCNPKIDNFTCLLFRLMLKADPYNLAKLAKQWPIEAQMVRIFHSSKDCPMDGDKKDVLWNEIEELAIEQLNANSIRYHHDAPIKEED